MRRSERRAKLTRDRPLDLYEHTDGFFVVDEAWTIRYWNHVMAERTGYEPDAVIGETLRGVFPEGEGDRGV